MLNSRVNPQQQQISNSFFFLYFLRLKTMVIAFDELDLIPAILDYVVFTFIFLQKANCHHIE